MVYSRKCGASKTENGKETSPERTLLSVLREEKARKIKGGIYHKIQIELTYNSNHIEGSRLTHDQTRFIYETNTIGMEKTSVLNVDDIVETANHFKCIDMIIDAANQPLSEAFLKSLHRTLKSGTSDSRKEWFAVGEYKRFQMKLEEERQLHRNRLPIKSKHYCPHIIRKRKDTGRTHCFSCCI